MTVGKNVKRLRQNKGITQEQLGDALGISGQAISKWENETALPDITILPTLADYFGISIDELLGYKLNALTSKERFVKFLIGNGILEFGTFQLKRGQTKQYYLHSERFTTNAQFAKIGEFFADCIKENHIEFDTITGLAYHGIALSSATACALFQKYGETANYCFDRKSPNSKGQLLCGHKPTDGEKIVVIDDLLTTGLSLCERIDHLKELANIEITAVLVLADLTNNEAAAQGLGTKMIEDKYGTTVYSILTEKDIHAYAATK